MTSKKRIKSPIIYIWHIVLGFLMVGVVICAIPSVAGFPTTHGGIPTGYTGFEHWNPYGGWGTISTTGFDMMFPDVDDSFAEILPPPSSSTGQKPSGETVTNNANAPLPSSSSRVDHWVKFSYFPAGSSSGQPAILSGYVGGKNSNAEVTIAGKKEITDVFYKIITIYPQENGLFVWAIPDNLAIVQFYQATAKVGGIPAKSEIISTSFIPVSQDPSSAYDTDTSAPSSSLPGITSLTLSADILRPAVGQDVTLSGSLTANGKGVSGATITIEVPDYGTDFLPLVSTTTDSSGRFLATINTWEDGVVPVQAVFSGDEKYQAATSSTLTFTAKAG